MRRASVDEFMTIALTNAVLPNLPSEQRSAPMLSFLRNAGAAAIVFFAGGEVVSLASEKAIDAYAPPPVIAQLDESSEPLTQSGAFRLVGDQQSIGGELASDCGKGNDDCDIELCDCCPPTWYASAGIIILRRSTPASGIIVAANPAGTEFHNADEWDFSWNTGVDVTLARRMGNGDILEARYFGVEFNEALNFVTPGNFIGAGFTGPGGTNFAGTYLSRLDSTELNWRRAWSDRLTFLAGFRWIELNEDLIYKLNGNVATGQYEFNNHLYGGQLGADWALMDPSDSLQINVVGKIGYYGNFVDGGIFEFQGNNFIGSFVGSDTVGAFVGELGISAAYQLTDCMAVRAGYQVLWINDVALSSDAASISLLNPSLLNDIHTGDLIYHGATLALDVVW